MGNFQAGGCRGCAILCHFPLSHTVRRMVYGMVHTYIRTWYIPLRRQVRYVVQSTVEHLVLNALVINDRVGQVEQFFVVSRRMSTCLAPDRAQILTGTGY